MFAGLHEGEFLKGFSALKNHKSFVSFPSVRQIIVVLFFPSQAVRYLAECRANREKLKGELGMMLSLQNVMQK